MTYRAEYEGLVLWVQREGKSWKQHVHQAGIDKGAKALWETPFGASVADKQGVYEDPATAQEAACNEATGRRHPDGECDCKAAGILWRQVADF